jgi:hypothetical protein
MRRLFFLLAVLTSQAVEVLTEGKLSYFIPTDAKVRSTYGEDGIQGGVEASFKAWDRIYPWLSVSLYHNSGISLVPLGAGLKYIYEFERLSVYGGLGVVPAYLKTHDSNWGYGGIGKVGVLSNRFWNLFIDFFGEYSYIHVPSADVTNLSNFTIGGGVGYWFGPAKEDEED